MVSRQHGLGTKSLIISFNLSVLIFINSRVSKFLGNTNQLSETLKDVIIDKIHSVPRLDTRWTPHNLIV